MPTQKTQKFLGHYRHLPWLRTVSLFSIGLSFIGALLFWNMLGKNYQEEKELLVLVNLFQLAQTNQQLIQAMQRERGLSVSLITRHSQPLAEKVRKAQNEVEQIKISFEPRLSELTEVVKLSQQKESLSDIGQQLGSLDLLRKAVHTKSLDSMEVFEQYSSLINTLLTINELIGIHDGTTSRLFAANELLQMINISYLIEYSGQERAFIGLALLQQRITPDIRRRLALVRANLTMYEQQILTKPGPLTDAFSILKSTPAFTEIEEFTSKWLNSKSFTELKLNHAEWWNKKTSTINDLGELQLEVARTIEQEISDKADEYSSSQSFYQFMLLLFILSLLSSSLIFWWTLGKEDSKERRQGLTIPQLTLCVLFFISAMALHDYHALQHVDHRIRQQSTDVLFSISTSTLRILKNTWLSELLAYSSQWATDPIVLNNFQQLMDSGDPKEYFSHPSQQKLRDYFSERLTRRKSKGMFIVSPQGLNIASMRDNNVGITNLVKIEYPELFERVKMGSQVFIPPIISDVPLKNTFGEKKPEHPTMFIASPIFNPEGSVVAILLVRLDPFSQFSGITREQRYWETGETYFIDKRGRLLTESRFKPELVKLKLLTEEESAILNINVREPGLDDRSGPAGPLTYAASGLLEGGIGGTSAEAYLNYRGKPVLGAWVWDNFLNMGVISEVDEAEIKQFEQGVTDELLFQMVFAGVISVLLIMGIYRVQKGSLQTLKASENKLRKNQLVLEKAEDIASFGSWELDVASSNYTVSKGTRELLGIADSHEQLPSSGLLAKVLPEDREGYSQFIRLILSDNSCPVNLDYQIRTKPIAGKSRVISVRGGVEKDAQDRIVKLIGVCRDVTRARAMELQQQEQKELLEQSRTAALINLEDAQLQKKRAETALAELASSQKALTLAKTDVEEREERMRAIVTNMIDAVITADENGLIQTFSHSAEQMFGYSAADVEGQNLSILMPQDVAHQHDSFIHNYKTSGNAKIIGIGREVVAKRSNGDLFPAELSIAKIMVQGQLIFSGLLRDITLRKQAENDLIEARMNAESASEAKSRFLATMSHEIRTPMNGVIGMLDILAQSELDNEQQRLATVAKNSSLALLEIINEILDFSKIESGKLEIEHIPYQWESIITAVLELVAEQARQKNLLLFFYIDPTLTNPILGDPVRLRQVMLNLLGNALKFTHTTPEKQGQIEINITREVEGSEWKLRLSVKDNGIGIAPIVQAKLFKAFSQADDSTHRVSGGTGLGLSISKGLCSLMGGELKLTSIEGVGSEFYAVLPLLYAAHSSDESLSKCLPGLKIEIIGLDSKKRSRLADFFTFHKVDNSCSSSWEDYSATAKSSDVLVISNEEYERVDAAMQVFSAANNAIPRVLVLYNKQSADMFNLPSHCRAVRANPFFAEYVAQEIGKIMGRIAGDDVATSAEITKEALPTPASAEQAGLLILIVEDNITNQEVLIRQINLCGYVGMIANHGAEALELINEHRFGLIITDCHMPVMDGYEFTAEVRYLESITGNRTPIIAATANALKGEAERCLKVGMDEFVTKPIQLKKLKGLLTKLLPLQSENVPQATSTRTKTSSEKQLTTPQKKPIDHQKLVEFLGPDEAFHIIFLQSFREENLQFTEQMNNELKAGNFPAAGDMAHQLKSASRTIGAMQLGDSSDTVEHLLKGKEKGDKEAAVSALYEQLEEVLKYIETLTAA